METLVTENNTSPILVEERSNKTFAGSKNPYITMFIQGQFCFICGLKCYESSLGSLLPLEKEAELSQFHRHAPELFIEISPFGDQV